MRRGRWRRREMLMYRSLGLWTRRERLRGGRISMRRRWMLGRGLDGIYNLGDSFWVVYVEVDEVEGKGVRGAWKYRDTFAEAIAGLSRNKSHYM